jgi:elongation factor 1 alpha-like protein
MTEFLTKTVGYLEENLTFIPTSGLSGENLTSKLPDDSKLKKWYDGPCLIELIDKATPPPRNIGGFMRACVSGKYHDNGYFAVAKIERG